MYILANKNTKRVMEVLDKKPVSFSKNLILLEVSQIPEKYDYLTATNVREITEYYTDVEYVEETNEKGEIITKTVEVEKSKRHFTCDLVAVFYGERVLTIEQKEKVRRDKIVNLIRKKYSIDDELAILRQKDSKPNKYNEYFKYVEDCVNNVPKQ